MRNQVSVVLRVIIWIHILRCIKEAGLKHHSTNTNSHKLLESNTSKIMQSRHIYHSLYTAPRCQDIMVLANDHCWQISCVLIQTGHRQVSLEVFQATTLGQPQLLCLLYSFFSVLGTALPFSHCVIRTAVSSTFRASALNSGFRARLRSLAHRAEYWM